MIKKFLLLTTIILNSSLYSQAPTGTVTGTMTLRNGKIYPNAKISYIDKDVIAELECGKKIVSKPSESQVVIKPLTRWKTQEECDQAEEEARQAAEKRKEEKRLKEEQRQQELALKKKEEAKRKEEKRLKEEQRRQELALKKQDCEDKGNVWNGRDCRKKSVTPVIPNKSYWSAFQGEMNWEAAKKNCESIGMRLPSSMQLTTVQKAGMWGDYQGGSRVDSYWTGQEPEPSGYDAYFVNMDDGIVYESGKEHTIGVRCVP